MNKKIVLIGQYFMWAGLLASVTCYFIYGSAIQFLFAVLILCIGLLIALIERITREDHTDQEAK